MLGDADNEYCQVAVLLMVSETVKCCQVVDCSSTVMQVPAQSKSLAAAATATITFDIFLTSSQAASLSCGVQLTDSQVTIGNIPMPPPPAWDTFQRARHTLCTPLTCHGAEVLLATIELGGISAGKQYNTGMQLDSWNLAACRGGLLTH